MKKGTSCPNRDTSSHREGVYAVNFHMKHTHASPPSQRDTYWQVYCRRCNFLTIHHTSWTHISMHTNTHTRAHTHTRMHTHVYTHTHTHTHTHTSFHASCIHTYVNTCTHRILHNTASSRVGFFFIDSCTKDFYCRWCFKCSCLSSKSLCMDNVCSSVAWYPTVLVYHTSNYCSTFTQA